AAPDHVHCAAQAETLAGHCESGTPLPRASASSQVTNPSFVVVVDLCQSSVKLVAASGAAAFVLVVNPGRRIEQPLQSIGAVERRGSPAPILVSHRLRNFDKALL